MFNPDQVKSTKNYASNGIKCLVFGPAGIGKTRLCATAPSPFIVSVESGLLSIANTDFPYEEVSSIEDLRDIYSFFVNQPNHPLNKQCRTICLDSISDICETILYEYKNGVTKKGKKTDPRFAYLQMSEDMSDIIRKFRDLKGKNVYFTAKEKDLKDDIGITKCVPFVPGAQLTASLPYFFDEVFYFNINQTEEGGKYTYLQTEQDLNHPHLKDRSGKLLPMEKPDLTHIINKIKGV